MYISIYYAKHRILKTSGRLVNYQDTYGRIEIWEVEEVIESRKHLQWSFEFNWNGTECEYTDMTSGDCPLRNLTSSQENAAYFEFRMKKSLTDSRHNPLIVVWYDLLNVPYALRPSLTDSFDELHLSELEPTPALGIHDLVSDFTPALIATGVLLVLFIIVMIVACYVTDGPTIKSDYMLDIRGYKCTFKTDELNNGADNIESRAKFVCRKHGPWLIVVLASRIAYMTVYTFTFFLLVFRRLNNESFHRVIEYNDFASETQDQLLSLSRDIDMYYYNETERIENEVIYRRQWCVDVYSNESLDAFKETSDAQSTYHTNQMNGIFDDINLNINLNNSVTEFEAVGPYGCNTDALSGAVGRLSDITGFGTNIYQLETIVSVPEVISTLQPINGTNETEIIYYNSTRMEQRTYYARDYRSNSNNFDEIREVLNERCGDSCAGWGFYNNDAESYFQLFYSLGSPILGNIDGICYEKPTNFRGLFTSPDSFINYTINLERQYQLEYEKQVQSLADFAAGLYGMFVNANGLKKVETKTEYYTNIDNAGINYDFNIWFTSENGYTVFDVNISCPGCPDDGDNITAPVLQKIGDAFRNFNQSSLNGTVTAVNASDLVTVNLQTITAPSIPVVELPNFDFPIQIGFIIAISVGLDIVLMVYRVYKTIGMLIYNVYIYRS